MPKRPKISDLAAEPKAPRSAGKAGQGHRGTVLSGQDNPELVDQAMRMLVWGNKAASILELVGYKQLAAEWREARKG